MVFAWLAATHYWFPKFSGRMYSEAVGKLAAWVAFIAFNATFFPMFIAGVQGMNRRVSVYLPYLEEFNPGISLWAFVLGLAFFVDLLNILVASLRGERASAATWGGTTLDWQTSSPDRKSGVEG